jgi:hypothetical protein
MFSKPHEPLRVFVLAPAINFNYDGVSFSGVKTEYIENHFAVAFFITGHDPHVS